MKKLFNGMILLATSLSLIGCGQTEASETKSEAVSETSVSEEISSVIVESVSEAESVSEVIEESASAEEQDPTYYALPDWQVTSLDISVGGDLLDIEVGRDFMTGADYNIYYSFGTKYPSVSADEKVVVSNEKVCTVERSGSTVTVHALHEGQTYLRIYDSNEIIRYCGLITVKDAIPQEDMEEYLVYEADYWKSIMGWGDSYVITFLDNGVYTMSATFSNEAQEPVTGTYEYVGISPDGKDYYYEFTDTEIDQLGFTGFYIAMTGTFMYLQEDGGTASILFPKEKAEAYLAQYED